MRNRLHWLLMLLILLFPAIGHSQDPTPFLDANPTWDYSSSVPDNASVRIQNQHFVQDDTVNYYHTLQLLCPAQNANWRLNGDAFAATGDETYRAEMVELMQQTEACYKYFGITETQLGNPYVMSFTISPQKILNGGIKPHVIGTVKLNRAAPGNGALVTIDSQNDDVLPYHRQVIISGGKTQIQVDLGRPNQVNIQPGQPLDVHVTASGADAHFIMESAYVQFYITPSTVKNFDYFTLHLIVNNYSPGVDNAFVTFSQSYPRASTALGEGGYLLSHRPGECENCYSADVRVLANSDLPLDPHATTITAHFRGLDYKAAVVVQPTARAGASLAAFNNEAGGETTLHMGSEWGWSAFGTSEGHAFWIMPIQTGIWTYGNVLGIQYQGVSNGNQLTQENVDWYGDTSQEWALIPTEPGFFEIKNLHSGLCLDDPAGDMADNAIDQWDCYAPATNEDWAFVNIGWEQDNQYVIVNRYSGKVLTIPNGDPSHGLVVHQQGFGWADYQKFKLYPLY